MVIRELKPSQRVEGRWLAVLEDGSILRIGEGEVVSFSLYTGKELTGQEVSDLQRSAKCSGLKEKALNLLSRKPQSRKELERKLSDWGASAQESQDICGRMEELGLLNERDYAQRIVRYYSTKGYGKGKIQDELYRRGVPRALWENAMEQAQDPLEFIERFLAKKLAGKAPDRQELTKVSNALARRGYRWDDIHEGLRRYGAELERW